MIVELVLAAVIALAAGLGGGYMLRRSTAEKAIGSAEAQAKKIVEEAEAKAEVDAIAAIIERNNK